MTTLVCRDFKLHSSFPTVISACAEALHSIISARSQTESRRGSDRKASRVDSHKRERLSHTGLCGIDNSRPAQISAFATSTRAAVATRTAHTWGGIPFGVVAGSKGWAHHRKMNESDILE
jgi:hypothetical protein